VPERIANKIVLTEDREQQNLVRRYLKRCGHNPDECLFLPRRTWPGGSGEHQVRKEFPRQVKAFRSSLGRKASALLIVMVDADTRTTKVRATQLSQALRDARMKQREEEELIVVLIPKRHVETWIRALLGNQVDEETDYKNPKPTPDEIREAAETLHQWTRHGAAAGIMSPPSLTTSLPEWQKIPS